MIIVSLSEEIMVQQVNGNPLPDWCIRDVISWEFNYTNGDILLQTALGEYRISSRIVTSIFKSKE